jgi:hypothetical protein
MLSPLFVLGKSPNFTSDCQILMPPTGCIFSPFHANQPTNKSTSYSPSFHAQYPNTSSALNTLISSKSLLGLLSSCDIRSHHRSAPFPPSPNVQSPRLSPNYELFNCNNFNIRYWSWNYRGCWHQTCPPIVSRKPLCLPPIPIAAPYSPAPLFSVTASLSQDWAICAPAAFLGSGSHLSGSLSGIEPSFPVTRQCHRRPLSYHPKLMGQSLS